MKGVTETPAPGSVQRTEDQPYVLDMLDEAVDQVIMCWFLWVPVFLPVV
ncbi:hypothetical protein [Endozoicomonas sp.]|nr:hypothetical protein [Endozoicomonas sp.]